MGEQLGNLAQAQTNPLVILIIFVHGSNQLYTLANILKGL